MASLYRLESRKAVPRLMWSWALSIFTPPRSGGFNPFHGPVNAVAHVGTAEKASRLPQYGFGESQNQATSRFQSAVKPLVEFLLLGGGKVDQEVPAGDQVELGPAGAPIPQQV